MGACLDEALLEPRDAKLAKIGYPSPDNKTAFGNVMFAEWKIQRAGGNPSEDYLAILPLGGRGAR